jgi:hypothetical protein
MWIGLALWWRALIAFFRSRVPRVSNKCCRHGGPQEEAFALTKRSSRPTRHKVVAATHLLRCDRNATVTMILQDFASRKGRVAWQGCDSLDKTRYRELKFPFTWRYSDLRKHKHAAHLNGSMVQNFPEMLAVGLVFIALQACHRAFLVLHEAILSSYNIIIHT